jgi:hypothetical protein
MTVKGYNIMNRKLAVLIVSCDKYKDTWNVFLSLLNKFWPDIPYKIYLGTNSEDFKYVVNGQDIQVIKSNVDTSWASTYRSFLNQIDEDYVLPFLDDFFIFDKVNTHLVSELFEIFLNEKIDCLSLTNDYLGKKNFKNYNFLKTIESKEEYIVNSGVNIWKKDLLKTFLRDNYTPWEFELKNSRNINNGTINFEWHFVAVKKSLFKLLNGVIRGKWVPQTVRKVNKIGVEVNIGDRDIMNKKESLTESMKFKLRKIFPVWLRKLFKSLLIKIGFKKLFVSTKYLDE